MIFFILTILITIISFVLYKMYEKNDFIKRINELKEEINSQMGSFIEKTDMTIFLSKAEILKDIAIKKKFSFDESALFISYEKTLAQMFYDNNVSVLEKVITTYIEEFTESVGGCKEYIITPNFDLFAKKFENDMKEWYERCKGYNTPVVQTFEKIYSHPKQFLHNVNKKYMEAEKLACNQMLSNIDGKSLDENQRNAVVNDDLYQLVIAGAGSGKTLTIAAKVKYLVERKGINPKDILLISFTRKAANEMGERIHNLGIDVDSSTFHQYGLKVISSVNKKTPDIAEDIGLYINKYLKEVIYNDNKLAKDFLVLLGTLMLPVFDGYQTLGERIELEQRQDLTTIKGMYEAYSNKLKIEELDKKIDELDKKLSPLNDKLLHMNSLNDNESQYLETKELISFIQNEIYNLNIQKRSIRNESMKSTEEVILANMFFLDGVKYQYEAEYIYDEPENYRKKYRPDFYMVESDVYWEHFGIDEDDSAKQYSATMEKKYLDSVNWKRNIHKNNSTKLAETYSWQFKKNKIVDAVNENYEKFNIKKNPVKYCDVIKEILKGDEFGNIESIKSLLSTFISLFKSYGYSNSRFEEIRKMIIEFKDKNLSEDAIERRKNRDLLFLDFAEKFYRYYSTMLVEEHKIDFNDMIIQAMGHIEFGTYVPKYKYIIIDEYQDISIGRYLLVKSTMNKSFAKLFCVGDDWQSIYRFTGSEIALLVSFEKYFGEFSRTDIVNTYRNSQELLDVSGKFIMENKYQNFKKLSSNKHLTSPIKVYRYTGSYRPICENIEDEVDIKFTQAFIESVSSIVNEFPNGDILVLGRNNGDIKLLAEDKKNINIFEKDGEMRICLNKFPNIKIKYLTVHRSKGLEADNVIIINARNSKSGFPNQIVDDPILNYLRDSSEEFEFAEERRLFYVALTRTRNYTYIIAPISGASRFLHEISVQDEEFEIKDDDDDAIENNNNVLDIYITKNDDAEFIENENASTLSCPACKVGTLVKRIGAEGKEFVSCSNYPIYNNSNKDLDVVRQNNRCPVCDNFLIKRKGIYGEFMGCMSYPYCSYTADIEIDSSKDEQRLARTNEYYNKISNDGRLLWTTSEDYQLKREYESNKSISQIAEIHNRSANDIKYRLKKLELI